jgi:hypothetical protein
MSGGSTLTLTETTVGDNTAGDDGGGIDTSRGGCVMLLRSTLVRNNASDNGGGINAGTGCLIVTQSTFVSNAAADVRCTTRWHHTLAARPPSATPLRHAQARATHRTLPEPPDLAADSRQVKSSSQLTLRMWWCRVLADLRMWWCRVLADLRTWWWRVLADLRTWWWRVLADLRTWWWRVLQFGGALNAYRVSPVISASEFVGNRAEAR